MLFPFGTHMYTWDNVTTSSVNLVTGPFDLFVTHVRQVQTGGELINEIYVS